MRSILLSDLTWWDSDQQILDVLNCEIDISFEEAPNGKSLGSCFLLFKDSDDCQSAFETLQPIYSNIKMLNQTKAPFAKVIDDDDGIFENRVPPVRHSRPYSPRGHSRMGDRRDSSPRRHSRPYSPRRRDSSPAMSRRDSSPRGHRRDSSPRGHRRDSSPRGRRRDSSPRGHRR
jgi:RNA recognition motif-containing protein